MRKSMVLLFVLIGAAMAAPEDDEQLKAGKDAIQKGDYTTAIAVLREAVKSDKKNPQAYILLGTALLKADSTDQAIGALVQARELDSANGTIYMLLGDAYARQKISVAAIEQYKKVTLLEPKNVDAIFKIADNYRRTRQYSEAAKFYDMVLALDSVNVKSMQELSSIYVRAKLWIKAAGVLEQLTRLEPDSLKYQTEYVKSLSESDQYEKLKIVGKAVLERDSTQLHVRIRLIEAYAKTRDYIEAARLAEHVNADSLSVEGLLDVGKAFRATEQWERAIDCYERALKKDSASCEVPYELGTTYMKVKKYNDAIGMFERKIACDTTAGYRFASHLNEAMSLMQLKKFADAKDHIQKSIDLRPDNLQAWLSLAQDLGQLDRTADEIAAYRKVIELGTSGNTNGDEGKYNTQLCEAYRMIGVRHLIDATKIDVAKEKERKDKFILSLDFLKKAVQYCPKDCSLLLWIAQANQNTNNKDEAKKYYHKVLENCAKAKEGEDAKKGLKALGEE